MPENEAKRRSKHNCNITVNFVTDTRRAAMTDYSFLYDVFVLRFLLDHVHKAETKESLSSSDDAMMGGKALWVGARLAPLGEKSFSNYLWGDSPG